MKGSKEWWLREEGVGLGAIERSAAQVEALMALPVQIPNRFSGGQPPIMLRLNVTTDNAFAKHFNRHQMVHFLGRN